MRRRSNGAEAEAEAQQWLPRSRFYTHEAFLLSILELMVQQVRIHPLISRATTPEDVVMLQGALREFSDLLNKCRGDDHYANGNDSNTCAHARRVVARVDQRQTARRERRRAQWTPRACAQCGARETEPKEWKVCSACCAVQYCCKEHQKQHWKAAHKRECKEMAAAGAAQAQPSASV